MAARLLLNALTALFLYGGLAGTVSAATFCCGITAIDKKTGIVTAENAKTKQLIRFKVDNAVLLNRIALDQKVDADLQERKASIEGIQGRFGIVSATPAAANRPSTGATARARPDASSAQARAPDACCTITNIDAKSGVVSARETATGRTFKFTVADASVLRGLRAGQPVHAHFASRQVSLDGRKPCCQMASAATDAKSRPPAGGTAAEQSPGKGAARGAMGGGTPAESGTGEAWEPSGATADMPNGSTPEWPQDGYSGTPADAGWPSDSGSGFPSGTADTGYPVDSGYGAFPSEQPGMQGEQPSLDAGKSYTYGSGEAPVQGDVPWWKQPLPPQ